MPTALLVRLLLENAYEALCLASNGRPGKFPEAWARYEDLKRYAATILE